jgi:ATP-dependent RNA helicase DDX5/DBP2
MLDMGFKKELDLILSSAPKTKQLIMWSATWPRDVSDLASDYTAKPVRVVVGAEELTANKRIKQDFVFCASDEKDQKLVEELKRIFYENEKEMPCTIVFANQKSKVAYLSERLSSAGLPSSCLHGDMSQYAREAAMAAFRSGKCKLLAATDVAARGIDMKNLKYVINYDFPQEFESYVHRIGRTARGADGVG